MRKTAKIILIAVGAVLLALAALLCFHFFGTKGQSREDVQVVPADNTVAERDEGVRIEDCSPTESLFILAGNLKKLQSYAASVSGEVNAGGIYKQEVSGEKYLTGEQALYVSRSSSALKKTGVQIYAENDVVLVREKEEKSDAYQNTATRYTLAEYVQKYGVDYRALSNYVLNENTIKAATLRSVKDGVYTYEYEIDTETGVDGYRVNMYQMGGLSELPEMKKCTLTVAMTADFMPVRITHTDEYSIHYFISLNCTSVLTETFDKINDAQIEIPDLAFFAAQIAE